MIVLFVLVEIMLLLLGREARCDLGHGVIQLAADG